MNRPGLFLLSLCITVCSCNFALYSNKFTKEQQTALFRENMDTHIDTLININGYYAGVADDSTYIRYLAPFLFFKDGGFVKFRFEDEYLYLKKKNLDLSNKQMSSFTGSYAIKGDTIICDVYCLYLMSWEIWQRYKFKIIDRNTLMRCELAYISKTDSTIYKGDGKVYTFIPATGLPSFDIDIKRKKWMWENKEEWKRYKKSLKAKKKKK